MPATRTARCTKTYPRLTAEIAEIAEQKISLRAPRLNVDSREASHAAEAPLGGDEADQHKEERRHVPQFALLDDGDAAAAVADGLRQRRDGDRGEETAAGVLGDALQQRRAHAGVEVLRVARRNAHVHRRCA